MEDEKIISMITGKKEEEIKEDIERNKRIVQLTQDLRDEIKKVSVTDDMLMTNIVSCMSGILIGLSKEAKMFILDVLIKSEHDGLHDRILEQIKKFDPEKSWDYTGKSE